MTLTTNEHIRFAMARNFLRPIRIEGQVAYVPLTQGYEAIVDKEDAALVSSDNWASDICRNTVYAVRSAYIGQGRQTKIRMHHLILPRFDDLVVDHIDGNGLNNRRFNLRLVSIKQNSRKQIMRSDNKSGNTGVSLFRATGKWRAYISVDEKDIHLGFFKEKEDAIRAYADAAKKFFGDFAPALANSDATTGLPA